MNKEANEEIRNMMQECKVGLEDIGNERGVTRQAIHNKLLKELSDEEKQAIMQDIANVTQRRAQRAEEVINA